MIKWTARAILALLLLATCFIPTDDGPLALYVIGLVGGAAIGMGIVALVGAAFGMFD